MTRYNCTNYFAKAAISLAEFVGEPMYTFLSSVAILCKPVVHSSSGKTQNGAKSPNSSCYFSRKTNQNISTFRIATTPILLCWENLDLGAHAVYQATLAESKVDFLLLNEIDVAQLGECVIRNQECKKKKNEKKKRKSPTWRGHLKLNPSSVAWQNRIHGRSLAYGCDTSRKLEI